MPGLRGPGGYPCPDHPGTDPAMGREEPVSDSDWSVEGLVEDFKAGRVSRREFVGKLAGIGLSAAIISACGGGTKSDSGPAAQATTGAGVATSAPQAQSDFKPTKRGGGGQLKVFWWQAPSILNPHLSSGTKDRDGSSIFYERLVYYDAEANLVPRLASEVPEVGKGTLDKDGKWVVWKLKKGVQWHDGTPFTAEDVVFTFQYATDTAVAALSQPNYKNVANVEKV